MLHKLHQFKKHVYEILSLFYYKVSLKTGFLLLFVRRENFFKTIPFKQWPAEIDLKKCVSITGKNIFSQVDVDSKVFLDKSITYGSELHSFRLVTYAAIIADKKFRKILKTQIKNWIKANKKITHSAWQPVIVSRRLYNWLSCYHNIIKTSEKEFHDSCLESISRQFCFLKKVRFLDYKITQIVAIYKTIIYCAFMTNNEQLFEKFSGELADILEKGLDNLSKTPPIKIALLLKDIEDICHICFFKKIRYIDTFQKYEAYLKAYIKYITNKKGLAVFNSRYTPSINFINALLQGDFNSSYIPYRYQRIRAFSSEILIDKLGEFFPFEFSFESQILSITNNMYFHIFNPENILNSAKVCNYELEQDHGYSLASGNSTFDYLLGKVAFSRRVYMNNLGTEIRGECIISSSFKMSIINEFIVYEDLVLEPLLYQNGVNIIFKNGRKLLLNLGKNIDLSFAKLDEKIINGQLTTPTVIRLEAFKNANVDCVCKWVLKEI